MSGALEKVQIFNVEGFKIEFKAFSLSGCFQLLLIVMITFLGKCKPSSCITINYKEYDFVIITI